MRIGLSFHGGGNAYEAYPQALQRRAAARGLDLETEWLAGTDRAVRLDVLESLDGVVFTGGPDVEPARYGFDDPEGVCTVSPARDAAEWEMLERLTAAPRPLLAICRGAQLLNVFHGGSLVADLGERNAVHRSGDDYRRRAHGVTLESGTLLAGIVGGATLGAVNSSHHQAVDRLASEFCVSALSEDGIIEAFEFRTPHAAPFLLAVQWHPEAMEAGLPLADRVLDALLTAASF
ncbi:MAG TPA: gamma-glutamyl-gamma-aminobutyrate hydrolase family protein [Candidatus Baltobacteraceae bacterium]|nr:gamma-glutamyl-gamma-aminobutyrate hydrolase family protein [Candidatus Baltobacteraceae bacterium]